MKIAATRPGRLASSTTRSPRRTASRTLCVTKITSCRVDVHSASSSSWSRSRVIASSAPNGSSMSSTSASWARARASATRWRMPPDSSCGRFFAKSPRCTISRSSSARGRRSLARHARELQRELDVAPHGQPREERGLLEHEAGALGADVDAAGRRLVETGDEVEQRALAAARRAEQADELALRDVERHALERDHLLAAGAEHLRDVGDGDDGTRSASRPVGDTGPEARSARSVERSWFTA